MDPKDYVLQDWGEAERIEMEDVYGRVVSAVEVFIGQGIREAMNRFNARPAVAKPSDGPSDDG
jgi:peptidyl-tRNA hydrolase